MKQSQCPQSGREPKGRKAFGSGKICASGPTRLRSLRMDAASSDSGRCSSMLHQKRRLKVTHWHFALAATVAIFAAPTISAGDNGAGSLVANLDLTSFPNSTGPRRAAGEFTFADYGFTQVEMTPGGAKLTASDGSWVMSFEIVSNSSGTVEICFHDQAIGRSGQIFRPSYNATSALRVTKSPRGKWSAQQVARGYLNCWNDPPAASG